jgi:hypothetical protein
MDSISLALDYRLWAVVLNIHYGIKLLSIWRIKDGLIKLQHKCKYEVTDSERGKESLEEDILQSVPRVK